MYIYKHVDTTSKQKGQNKVLYDNKKTISYEIRLCQDANTYSTKRQNFGEIQSSEISLRTPGTYRINRDLTHNKMKK